MKYRVTRTYWKDVVVEADSPEDAKEIACLNYLFDDVTPVASDVFEIEETEDEMEEI